MITQDTFMVVAPIVTEKKGDLLALLATMNEKPGQADPANPVLPFGEFQELHFARFVVLDNPTLGDLAYYRAVPSPTRRSIWPSSGTAMGPPTACSRRSGAAPRQAYRAIFSHCQGLNPRPSSSRG